MHVLCVKSFDLSSRICSCYRKESLEKKKLMVAEVPWRPANPPKKAGGLGQGNRSTHFGTVDYKGAKTPAFPEGGRIEYLPQGSAAKLKKGDVQFALPNILTNPIKKGHFGVANTTIGVPGAAAARRAWKGVTNEYSYMPDPYEGARARAREERAKGPKNVSEAPFRPASYTPFGGAPADPRRLPVPPIPLPSP